MIETTCIIEHLQAHHPGANRWIPDGELGRRVRLLDRFFDLHVMGNMQVPVANKLRPEGAGDDYGEARAREKLHIAYDWLEGQLGEPWAVGEAFTLADCAAAPSLFYADWVEEIGPTAAEAGGLSRAASGPSRLSRAPSMRAGLIAAISRSARPTATKRTPPTFRSSCQASITSPRRRSWLRSPPFLSG